MSTMAEQSADGPRLFALQYHYRPGTITGWIADLLERHAIRRRSASSPPMLCFVGGAAARRIGVLCQAFCLLAHAVQATEARVS